MNNLIDVLALFILSNLKLTKIYVTQTTRSSAVWGYWNLSLGVPRSSSKVEHVKGEDSQGEEASYRFIW